jgi:hypothetical protein
LFKKFNKFSLIGPIASEIMTIGYCVKCRDKRDISGAKPYTMKNGKPAIKGTCPTCKTAIFRIGRG